MFNPEEPPAKAAAIRKKGGARCAGATRQPQPPERKQPGQPAARTPPREAAENGKAGRGCRSGKAGRERRRAERANERRAQGRRAAPREGRPAAHGRAGQGRKRGRAGRRPVQGGWEARGWAPAPAAFGGAARQRHEPHSETRRRWRAGGSGRAGRAGQARTTSLGKFGYPNPRQKFGLTCPKSAKWKQSRGKITAVLQSPLRQFGKPNSET